RRTRLTNRAKCSMSCRFRGNEASLHPGSSGASDSSQQGQERFPERPRQDGDTHVGPGVPERRRAPERAAQTGPGPCESLPIEVIFPKAEVDPGSYLSGRDMFFRKQRGDFLQVRELVMEHLLQVVG